MYGPHQFPEKVVPKFVMLASGGHKLPVHGTGLVTRSYLYVEDVAEAFDIILHRGVTGETYNVGSERERSVLDAARDICNCLGKDFDALVEHVDDRRFNDRRYHIDDAKLRALGWEESTPRKKNPITPRIPLPPLRCRATLNSNSAIPPALSVTGP